MTFKKILCPVDFSKHSSHAIQCAVALAEQFKATLYVIHVIPIVSPFSYTSYYNVDDKTDMANLCAKEIPQKVEYQSEIIKHDDDSEGIIEYAKSNKVDLIVIGTHGHNSVIESVLLGNTAEDVTRNATCPVMVVRETNHAHS